MSHCETRCHRNNETASPVRRDSRSDMHGHHERKKPRSREPSWKATKTTDASRRYLDWRLRLELVTTAHGRRYDSPCVDFEDDIPQWRSAGQGGRALALTRHGPMHEGFRILVSV